MMVIPSAHMTNTHTGKDLDNL